MMGGMAKRGRLIAVMAVSIAILLLASGLPVAAYGPQNSGQNNPGYVKYTLDLINNTLINGNFVNTSNGMGPWGIAYDPSNGYIYVTNLDSNTVSVINGKTNTVIATIPVGQRPVGVAYDPSNGYIYVTNSGSGTVSVISTSVSTSSSSISSVTTPTTSTSTSSTSTSTKPTPGVVPTWAVAAVVVVVVLMVALLMIKRRKP